METLSVKALIRLSVNIIAKHGVSEIRKMNADLVSPSRFEPQPQMSIAAILLYHRVVGDRIPRIFGRYAHFLAVGLVSAYRRVDSFLQSP